jgi:adenosylcobinamide-GDP ribazoletransferase
VPVLGWAAVLAALTLWVSPWVLLALVLVPLVEVFWRRRLGGINGDCLGASIEVTESALLVVVVVVSLWA